jgi:hypothetical protein
MRSIHPRLERGKEQVVEIEEEEGEVEPLEGATSQ